MYEYKFVRIELGIFSNKPKEDYQTIVQEHAKDGWRFVQVFAPSLESEGEASYFEIIFERSI